MSNEFHRAYERYDADRKKPKIEPKEIKEEDNEKFIKLEESKKLSKLTKLIIKLNNQI